VPVVLLRLPRATVRANVHALTVGPFAIARSAA
jgi:hypothetical protein